MSQDKIFADGFIFKRRENAPDFVIGNISVKILESCFAGFPVCS